MRELLYKWLFRILRVTDLYEQMVVNERQVDVRSGIRRDLTRLLERVNRDNPFFNGRFTDFLGRTSNCSDADFFGEYARLPALGKEDYARAGLSVMPSRFQAVDPSTLELQFRGRPVETLRQLRRGGFLMPMATGGSTSLPLVIQMTREHMFNMLFTFFKCWYRMGWRPGKRMLIFYPRNTYNIDDMVKFNPYSRLTGFRYHLFDRIDEDTVRELVEDINRFRPDLLLVFPSPMNVVAHTIRRLQIPLRHCPARINVSGETFFDCQRANIQSVFTSSRIEDSYGSVELGEIAHETEGGLEVFANVAYVETVPNANDQPELVVTSLWTTDFPFIRYRMRDVAEVRLEKRDDGTERFLIKRLEGKDSSFIGNSRGEQFFPSFFNRMVNTLNSEFGNAIIEIKVRELACQEIEVLFIVRENTDTGQLSMATIHFLQEHLCENTHYSVRFVDYMDHDYRRKYRAIEHPGDIEFAGGIVGDPQKAATIVEIEALVASNGNIATGVET
jgi:phenylacetate-coenzyme A ligase PaaK-like adenylate-forming protein